MSALRSAIWMMALITGMASAQDYPSKTIRIFASAPGGGGDFNARQIAQGISGPLGQSVVVVNLAGLQVAQTIVKSAPDGYSLMVQGATVWLTPLLQDTGYDPERDFLPITMTARDVFVMVVHPSLPVKTVKELIALAKSRPGQINYASSTPGGQQFRGMELLKFMTGIDVVAVPYKGGAPAFNSVLAGETVVTIADTAQVLPNAKAGKVRALAVTSLEPSPLAPGLPTVASAGLPGYELVGATGMWAPGKTPAAIVNRLNQEVVRFLNRPETKERFFAVQQEVVANTPEQFAAAIKSDMATWSKLFKATGIKKES